MNYCRRNAGVLRCFKFMMCRYRSFSYNTDRDKNLKISCPNLFSHNGVIYVIGGDDGTSNLSSVEMYNPKVKLLEMQILTSLPHLTFFHQTDTWNVLAANMTIGRSYTGVAVIDRPSFL